METILTLIIIQAFIGAYDTIYHHDLREGLPFRPTAALELKIHSMRSFLYSVMFFTLAWAQPLGAFAVLFAAIIVIEIGLTFWDFVVEDQTRVLPPTERIVHSILGFNFAVIVTLLIPIWWEWLHQPTALQYIDYGVESWVLTLFGFGVLPFSWREWTSYRRLSNTEDSAPNSSFVKIPPKNILVTGATGFIGNALCRVLLSQGHTLTLLARDFKKAADIGGSRLTLINSLNVLTPDTQFDVVINLAGEPIADQRWTSKRKASLIASRVELTRKLVHWISTAKHKPSVLISGSAIGYYGPQQDTQLDETGQVVDSFSHQLCNDWESAALQAESFGTRVVLMRTGIVIGRQGGALLKMLSPFSLGLGGQIGNGQQWMSWIHLDDWIGIALKAISTPEISGPVNATAPEPVTNKVFTRTLGRALHRPTWMTMPAFAVNALFGEMGQELLLNGQKVLPEKMQKLGYQYKYSTLLPAIKEVINHA
jgi:uncharacterized protein (TIGR01777 family)